MKNESSFKKKKKTSFINKSKLDKYINDLFTIYILIIIFA